MVKAERERAKRLKEAEEKKAAEEAAKAAKKEEKKRKKKAKEGAEEEKEEEKEETEETVEEGSGEPAGIGWKSYFDLCLVSGIGSLEFGILTSPFTCVTL